MRAFLIFLCLAAAAARLGGPAPSTAPGRVSVVRGRVVDGVFISERGMFPIRWAPDGIAEALIYDEQRLFLRRWSR